MNLGVVRCSSLSIFPTKSVSLVKEDTLIILPGLTEIETIPSEEYLLASSFAKMVLPSLLWK